MCYLHTVFGHFEYAVHAVLHGPQVLVKVEVIMMLLDFMWTSIKPLTTSNPKAISALEKEVVLQSRLGIKHLSISYETAEVDSVLVEDKKEEAPGKIVVVAVIKKPFVALLEHSNSANPRALVLQASINVVHLC